MTFVQKLKFPLDAEIQLIVLIKRLKLTCFKILQLKSHDMIFISYLIEIKYFIWKHSQSSSLRTA